MSEQATKIVDRITTLAEQFTGEKTVTFDVRTLAKINMAAVGVMGAVPQELKEALEIMAVLDRESEDHIRIRQFVMEFFINDPARTMAVLGAACLLVENLMEKEVLDQDICEALANNAME